jgi:ClpP class serine protease
MTPALQLATRYAGRPVLMRQESALEIALQLRDMDPRVLARPGRFDALLRKLSRTRQASRGGVLTPNAVRVPAAMEDDFDGPPPVPFEQRAAYFPLYAGEVEDTGYCWSLKSGVALMECDTAILDRGDDFCGVHHGYDTLLAGMQEAMADERVKAVFLRLASPGGVVAGGLASLAAFMRLSRGGAGGKPIHVYADMACSAAYWIAAQADRIVAPSVGLVGSIGAVIVHEDYSQALEKAGVAIEAIQFGESKTDGAWWAALSAKARADLQAEIDQCGRNFVADVTAGRPQLTPEALLATQAAVYMGEHDEAARSGLALGFVDEIMGEADAFAALVEQVSSPATIFTPKPAAPGGPHASTTKDKPMADKAPTQPGRTSAAAPKASANQARAAELRAELARLEAAPDAPEGEDTEDAAENNDSIEAGAGADQVDGGAGGDVVDAAEAEARAISASPEAKAHPALALSAISTGMTLAQFHAAASAAAAPGKNRLGAVMAGTSRLGPDGKAGEAGAATAPVIRSASDSFQANLKKGLEARQATRR